MNMQNLPRAGTSNVKEVFESRFGEDGLLAEIDYSQLEIVVQQVMTGDIKLGEDLRAKIDFHCKRVATAKKEDYEHVWFMCHVKEDKEYKAERTKKKIFSFQRAYGGGATLIAQETGMALQEVKDMIAAEDIEYPAVPEFDKMLEKNNLLTRINSGKKLYINGVAFTQGEAHWDSPTGTRYTFREGITPKFMQDRGIYVGFSPTERKNYPVQGFAGEIVQTMFGLVWRHMIANKRYGGDVLLCNSVHDCIITDGKKELQPTVAKELQRILESVPEVFNKAYSTLNVTVPFPCETEIGANFYKMEVLHDNTGGTERTSRV
jgi:DNA polymerase I-like protein with 3'-5' exonuclease and polymerase domains